MTIELYSYRTPNGRKASIMLAETGRPYRVRLVDIEKGEQRAVVRLFNVLDRQLGARNYLVGNYGIADIATWPWIHARRELDLSLDGYGNLKRWHDDIAMRPAVQRGVRVSDHQSSSLGFGGLNPVPFRHVGPG